MHLFQSPWLRAAAATPSRSKPRRAGAARRIAVLLQLEAARKPSLDPALDLVPAPATQACVAGGASLQATKAA